MSLTILTPHPMHELAARVLVQCAQKKFSTLQDEKYWSSIIDDLQKLIELVKTESAACAKLSDAQLLQRHDAAVVNFLTLCETPVDLKRFCNFYWFTGGLEGVSATHLSKYYHGDAPSAKEILNAVILYYSTQLDEVVLSEFTRLEELQRCREKMMGPVAKGIRFFAQALGRDVNVQVKKDMAKINDAYSKFDDRLTDLHDALTRADLQRYAGLDSFIYHVKGILQKTFEDHPYIHDLDEQDNKLIKNYSVGNHSVKLAIYQSPSFIEIFRHPDFPHIERIEEFVAATKVYPQNFNGRWRLFIDSFIPPAPDRARLLGELTERSPHFNAVQTRVSSAGFDVSRQAATS